MRLEGERLTVELPTGWDLRIGRTAADEIVVSNNPLVHAANFPLPQRRGDFGSGAVDIMGPSDTFVSLFEFGPESLGQPLFANEGLPQELDPDEFHPSALQRVIPGQAGVQRFFTAEGRPFCLYVVLGEFDNRRRLVPSVSEFLSGVRVDPWE